MPQLSLGRAARYAPLLCAAMEERGITSAKRRCAFLAQLAHESDQLCYMEEIASGAAYEGRTDLGNIEPGDGKRYKGRGPIQLTGRANYRHFGRILGLDLEGDPELAAVPEHGFRIAALFWQVKRLNELADNLTLQDLPADYQVFRQITRRINGGVNGLADRWNYYKKSLSVLRSSSPQPVEKPEGAAATETPATVSAESGSVLDAAVNSPAVKQAAPKLWPRLTGLGMWLFGLYQANQMIGNIVVVAALIAIGLLVYWKWPRMKASALKLLK